LDFRLRTLPKATPRINSLHTEDPIRITEDPNRFVIMLKALAKSGQSTKSGNKNSLITIRISISIQFIF